MKNWLLLVILIIVGSCSKGKLKDELEVFQGTFEWTSTGANKDAWTHASIDNSNTGYTITVQFDDEGNLFFYKNGLITHNHKYQIIDDEMVNGGGMIMIKLKKMSSDLKITDSRITVRISGDTSLTMDRYPFPAIDNADNYYSGYNSTSNHFLKQ